MEKRENLKIPPAGAWTFQSPEIAESFDAHVREQLPWYALATGLVAHVARHFIPENGTVIDIGASTGNVGRALAETLDHRNATLIALDTSPEMLKRYRGPGAPVIADAADFPFADYAPDLIVAFLVLMFVAPAVRSDLIARMKAALRPGGALLVFDKREPDGGEIGQISYRLALAAKYEAGATPADILAKELALAGVQRPLAPAETAGLSEIFRFGDFSGWVYTAPKGLAQAPLPLAA